VDEEHETSYKQEDKVNYHARDMAVLRGHIEKIPVILCSATPCLETVDNCRKNKYQEITLASRYGKSVMPDVLIADMRGKKLEKNSFISPFLQQKLLNNLLAEKQSLLFLNRRGYAPLTICKPCGYKMNCPNCSAWLVAHKASNNLICHHCAYSCKLPKHCPQCKEENSFIACGPGIERIEEEVKLLMPNARVLNMSKDELSTPKKAQITINKILNREIDVIVGTQVIAKGHHFPALSLVGVIDADIGLASGGDLRSAEKTYQLLHQVAGRAGREEQKGAVVIQTYQPDNIIIKALVEHNREDFINYELKMRQQSHMPPYSRLASIVIADTIAKRAESFAKELVKVAPYHPGIKIFGPVPAILAKLKRKYRYRILIKSEKTFNIQRYIQNWLSITPPHWALQVKIDIDPYYFN
jgi:primosomal protein N' (replication factor Y)